MITIEFQASSDDIDNAIQELADQDGAAYLIANVPGVWEAVSEHYNNDAIDHLRDNGCDCGSGLDAAHNQTSDRDDCDACRPYLVACECGAAWYRHEDDACPDCGKTYDDTNEEI